MQVEEGRPIKSEASWTMLDALEKAAPNAISRTHLTSGNKNKAKQLDRLTGKAPDSGGHDPLIEQDENFNCRRTTHSWYRLVNSDAGEEM